MKLFELDCYVVCLKFTFQKLFIIWISDEVDGVAVNECNQIITFKTHDELIGFSENQNIICKEGVTVQDLGKIQRWINEPDFRIDCEEFLNFWNLCTDISHSLKIKFLGDIKNKARNIIYDKLFDQAGPFIITEPIAIWSDHQIIMLKKIMQDGLSIILDNLYIVN